MSQRKITSLIESCCNVGSGFVISCLIWRVLCPLMGYEYNTGKNITITAVFTVVSIVRGYIWRRMFNKPSTKGQDHE